jgi:hypothetical protein
MSCRNKPLVLNNFSREKLSNAKAHEVSRVISSQIRPQRQTAKRFAVASNTSSSTRYLIAVMALSGSSSLLRILRHIQSSHWFEVKHACLPGETL